MRSANRISVGWSSFADPTKGRSSVSIARGRSVRRPGGTSGVNVVDSLKRNLQQPDANSPVNQDQTTMTRLKIDTTPSFASRNKVVAGNSECVRYFKMAQSMFSVASTTIPAEMTRGTREKRSVPFNWTSIALKLRFPSMLNYAW